MSKPNELWQELSEYSIKTSEKAREGTPSNPKDFSHFFIAYKAYVEVHDYVQKAEILGIDPLDYFISAMNSELEEKQELASLLRLDPEGLEVNAGMIDAYEAIINIAEEVQNR